MLEHKHVLIVEANSYRAMDLCDAFERLGALILGPAFTLAEARSILASAHVSGAVVDCDLPSDDIKQFAKILAKRSVPFVLQCSEALPPEIAMIRPGAPILIKPINVGDVAVILANEIKAARS